MTKQCAKNLMKTNIVEWGCTHVSGCTSHRTQNHKLAPYFEEENSALVMSLLAEKKETFIIEKVLAWWSLVCLKGDLSIQLSKYVLSRCEKTFRTIFNLASLYLGNF